MRPPQGDPPTSSTGLLPTPEWRGCKGEEPLLTTDSRLPSPTSSGRGTEGSPTENWDLTLITTTHCTHTPKGKGGNSCRGLLHFSFPCGPEPSARHPHQLPPPEPRDRHRNQFWRGGGRAQSFPNALPENTGRGRKQETPKVAGGEIVALSSFSRPEVKFSYSAKGLAVTEAADGDWRKEREPARVPV